MANLDLSNGTRELTRQDLAILLLYYLGFSKVRSLAHRLQRRAITRFITFHDVPEHYRQDFFGWMRFLRQSTNVVSMEDYFAGKLSATQTNMVITFDDGFRSWASVAAPVLLELGLPATFFICSGFVGLSDTQRDQFVRTRLMRAPFMTGKISGALDEDDVAQLAAAGFEIGGHTCNHVDLSNVNDRAELDCEIVEDKKRLEAVTGKPVRYFAYPYGASRNESISLPKVLEEAGFIGAVTTQPGLNMAGANAYLLRRDLASFPMPMSLFRARVLGTGDGVEFVKRFAERRG